LVLGEVVVREPGQEVFLSEDLPVKETGDTDDGAGHSGDSVAGISAGEG